MAGVSSAVGTIETPPSLAGRPVAALLGGADGAAFYRLGGGRAKACWLGRPRRHPRFSLDRIGGWRLALGTQLKFGRLNMDTAGAQAGEAGVDAAGGGADFRVDVAQFLLAMNIRLKPRL